MKKDTNMVETVVIENVAETATPEDQEIKRAPKVDLEKYKLVRDSQFFSIFIKKFQKLFNFGQNLSFSV